VRFFAREKLMHSSSEHWGGADQNAVQRIIWIAEEFEIVVSKVGDKPWKSFASESQGCDKLVPVGDEFSRSDLNSGLAMGFQLDQVSHSFACEIGGERERHDCHETIHA
jgi:hypothetical protein